MYLILPPVCFVEPSSPSSSGPTSTNELDPEVKATRTGDLAPLAQESANDAKHPNADITQGDKSDRSVIDTPFTHDQFSALKPIEEEKSQRTAGVGSTVPPLKVIWPRIPLKPSPDAAVRT